MSASFTRKDIAAAQKVLAQVRDEWLQHSCVTAIDIGFHTADGVRRDELAIRVHVRPDTTEDEAIRAAFPEKLGRFPVDIIGAEYELQEATAEDK